MRLTYQEIYETFFKIFRKYDVNEEKSKLIAETMANNSLEGVISHGVYRFKSCISAIESGAIDKESEPECLLKTGAVERWDGKSGFGIVNAHFAMSRAVALSHDHGIGLVALRNTNHWLREGSYGILAAKAGCIGICWTNTIPIMPAWGAKDPRIGNNPMVISIPNGEQYPIVLDFAMAQFSYGKLESTKIAGNSLPMNGGYDRSGNLTTDPAEILATKRVLPIGFWKGSGLSIVLDLLAMILSGGHSTMELGQNGSEKDISQIFIAIDPALMDPSGNYLQRIRENLDYILESEPMTTTDHVAYPGQGSGERRIKYLREGIPVDEVKWQEILELL